MKPQTEPSSIVAVHVALTMLSDERKRYAYSKDGRAEKLYQHLPRLRRNRRPRGMRKHYGSQFLEELAITHRPETIADRVEFGHWECDLVMFRNEFGKANVTSLVKWVSRFAVVLKNPDRQSKPVMEGLISSLSPLPKHARRSITFDRGTEFSAWLHLKAGLGVDPWFCDPRSPWQKGRVENTNNRLRRYLPSKSIFEVDLRPPQHNAAQVFGVSNARLSLPRKTDGRSKLNQLYRSYSKTRRF